MHHDLIYTFSLSQNTYCKTYKQTKSHVHKEEEEDSRLTSF